MIDNFDDWRSGRKANRLRSRVRKGIPDCVRGKVWQMMAGSMVSSDQIRVHVVEYAWCGNVRCKDMEEKGWGGQDEYCL